MRALTDFAKSRISLHRCSVRQLLGLFAQAYSALRSIRSYYKWFDRPCSLRCVERQARGDELHARAWRRSCWGQEKGRGRKHLSKMLLFGQSRSLGCKIEIWVSVWILGPWHWWLEERNCATLVLVSWFFQETAVGILIITLYSYVRERISNCWVSMGMRNVSREFCTPVIFGRGCDFLSLLQEEHALTEDCKGMAMQFY